jgi:hypothetical protein
MPNVELTPGYTLGVSGIWVCPHQSSAEQRYPSEGLGVVVPKEG